MALEVPFRTALRLSLCVFFIVESKEDDDMSMSEDEAEHAAASGKSESLLLGKMHRDGSI